MQYSCKSFVVKKDITLKKRMGEYFLNKIAVDKSFLVKLLLSTTEIAKKRATEFFSARVRRVVEFLFFMYSIQNTSIGIIAII
jgi:hypothetical protein